MRYQKKYPVVFGAGELLKIFYSLIFFSFLSVAVTAQTDQPGYYIRGIDLFKQKQYYDALQYFEKYLTTEIKNTPRSQPFAVRKKSPGKSNLNMHQAAVYHLAECYRLTNNYTMAEKWYGEAMSYSRKAYPACPYWYGVSLRANQKYEEAFKIITAFRESYRGMDELLVGADRELENLKFIREQLGRSRDEFFVTRQPMPNNSTAYGQTRAAEYHTVYTSVFEDKANERIVARLFEKTGEESTEKETMLNPGENPEINNGLASFSRDGKKMFFTRWVNRNGITQSAIYTSDRTDTGWSKPVALPEPLNMKGWNSAQPFLTPDGKYLLFSSDREGGTGNYDIWYATLDNQFHPLLVTNAGNIVNTQADEATPSYHQNSRTLLFSSNGHAGMGGYDVFSAKGDFQLSNWDKPVNAGNPINSSKDDLYYISTDEDNLWNTGWLSSDRATDCCLELFNVRQNNAQYVSGQVIDCNSKQPIAGATLTVKDPRQKGKVLIKKQTNADGTYDFELRNTSHFDINVEKSGFQISNESFSIFFDAGTDSVTNNNICLSPVVQTADKRETIKLNESVVLAKFSFNRSSIGNQSYYELDSLAAFMKQYPSTIVEVGGYTDGKGQEAYNLQLAQKRVDACIRYLLKKGIPKDRLVGKAYGECCPLEPELIDGKDNPAARERNRRVEYRVVNDKNDLK